MLMCKLWMDCQKFAPGQEDMHALGTLRMTADVPVCEKPVQG